MNANTGGPASTPPKVTNSAAAVAALTVYDMTKSLDKGIRIERLELREKTGGKSGRWRAEPGS